MLSSIVELIPFVGVYEAFTGENIITHEKLDDKERLFMALSEIPPFKIIKSGNKIGKMLSISYKTSKNARAIKTSKTVGKNLEKKANEALAKKGVEINNTSNVDISKILPISNKIPMRLKLDDGRVDRSKFYKKIKGKAPTFKEKGGYFIEGDSTKHGGSLWKLKNEKGKRIASLSENMEILRK